MAKNKYKRRTDGTFETKLQTGYDNNGKRVRLSVTAGSSSQLEEQVMELKLKLKQLKKNFPDYNGLDYKHMLLDNSIVKCSEMVLEEYALNWFLVNKSKKEVNTKAMYLNILNTHIIPNLGFIKVNHLKHSDLQRLLTDTFDKPRTCQQILMTMKQIIKSLKRDGLISPNAFDNLIDDYDIPKYTSSPKRALTDLEKKSLLIADFSKKQKAFVFILFYFGLRREEALGLIKSDFDFTNMKLKINRAIIFDGNSPVLKSSTKSFAGKRSIYIPEDVYPFLKDYVNNCSSLYIFTKQDGGLITKSSYDKMWASIIRKMNLAVITEAQAKLHQFPITDLTAHIFRHNYCTMLYYSGISILKAVELMGHADKKMIMDIYAHLDEEKENAAEKINSSIRLKMAL
ncbi:MAG: site-specific integrase [Lachnospiraceae bacterium]|nr:site-specific integrase [Lachnospiraceae bacterium]